MQTRLVGELFRKNIFTPDHSSGGYLPPRQVGLEVEVECIYDPEGVVPDGWKAVPEGSIRDGVEFIFDGPAQGNQAQDRIGSLCSMLGETSHVFTDRCSVHVHVDVTDLTLDALRKVIISYALLEPWLLEICGKSRVDNIFCLPMLKIYGFVERLRPFIAGDNLSDSILDTSRRYSGLNLSSLPTFGTIEFRSMRGTSDKDLILDWVKILTTIIEYSNRSPLSVNKFIRKINLKGGLPMAFEILGPLFEKYGNEHNDQLLIQQGMSTVVDLAFDHGKFEPERAVNSSDSSFYKYFGV